MAFQVENTVDAEAQDLLRTQQETMLPAVFQGRTKEVSRLDCTVCTQHVFEVIINSYHVLAV